MDAFSDAEIAVLMNHGYLLANIAIEVHVPHLSLTGWMPAGLVMR
jgi:hypothetical protein